MTKLNKYITNWCVSCDYHVLKRYKKLFAILFKENNLKPCECYFIDDKLINIEIGKLYGMVCFELN